MSYISTSWQSEYKICIDCKKERSIKDFCLDKNRLSQIYPYCRECRTNRQRVIRLKDPEKYRLTNLKSNLKKRYNISLEEYDNLLLKYNNKCGNLGCDRDAYAIDHDHKCCNGSISCGKCIRGMLCLQCNTAIGLLRENKDAILGLIKYLEGDR